MPLTWRGQKSLEAIGAAMDNGKVQPCAATVPHRHSNGPAWVQPVIRGQQHSHTSWLVVQIFRQLNTTKRVNPCVDIQPCCQQCTAFLQAIQADQALLIAGAGGLVESSLAQLQPPSLIKVGAEMQQQGGQVVGGPVVCG